MAPQFSLSNDSVLNTLNSTINGQYTQASNGSEVALVGSHFKNSLFVAPIVINAICAVAFIILIFYSWMHKMDDARESKKTFAVMMSLIGGMALSFSRSFADEMVHEYTPRVPSAFLILPAFKPVINNTVDVTVIGVIYRIIKNRNKWLRGDHVGFKRWQQAHSFSVLLLAVLGLADTALYIYGQVLLFTQNDGDPKLLKAASRYKDVHLAYTTFYLVVTLEILGCVAFLYIQARHQNLQSRIITYLVTLVSPWLVLRSAIILAAAVRFSFQTYTESRILSVVATALWGFPSVAIFTGLVLIQFNRGWSREPRLEAGGPGTVRTVGTAGGERSAWSSQQHQHVEHWKTPMVQNRYDYSR